MRWRGAALALGLGLAVAAPACGAGGAGAGGVRTVDITVHHSQFSIATLHVRAGQTVRFVVHNTDPIAHELIVGDQAVQDAHEAGTDAHHDAPGQISVDPGTTAVTTYTFGPAGAPLLFGCHLPGHWAYGMHGTIRVG